MRAVGPPSDQEGARRSAQRGGARSSWKWVALVLAWGALVGGGPLLIGPPGGDDAYYHAMYAVEHARCWRGGVLWPIWYPDLVDGLGAPEPRARPALPLALHAGFALVFDDAVAATSLATLLIPMCAGLIGFLVARRRGLPQLDAAVAGLVWAGLPYLVVTLHQRAALQEAWAVAVLPWVLDALLPPRPRNRREVLVAAGAFAVLVAVQLLVAFMVAVTVGVAHLVSPARRRLPAAVAGIAGMAFAAASWVPNLAALGRVESSFFTAAWFDWRHRLLLTPGSPEPELATVMTWALAGVVASSMVVFVADRSRRGAAAAVVAVAALATPAATPLYAGVPGLSLLQFPWRWLAVASALALFACLNSPKTWRGVALAVLLLPVIAIDPVGWRLSAGPPLAPSADRSAITRSATRYGVPPILPPFPAMLPRGVDLAIALQAGRRARATLPPPRQGGPEIWRWELDVSSNSQVVLPLLAAPGWRVGVNGTSVGWWASEGLIAAPVSPGRNVVEARQTALPEDRIGGAVSLAAFVALGLGYVRRKGTAASG